MFTRKDYLADKCTHREYYAQFVTDDLRAAVRARFGDKPKMSGNLSAWDALFYGVKHMIKPMKEHGDYLTLAGGVCTLKEAALQNMNADETSAKA